MKTTSKHLLAVAACFFAGITLATAPSVTNQEATDYVLLNTPYNYVYGITEVGIDRRVDVESTENDVYLYVEWDEVLEDYVIDHWENIPLDCPPGG